MSTHSSLGGPGSVRAPADTVAGPEAGPATMGAIRVAPNAAHAFGGIWRLTSRRFFSVTHWLILLGFFVLLVVFSIPAAPNRAAAVTGFLPWASRFYVCFLVPVLAFVAGAGVMRDDLRSDSVDYILTRPVRRPLFVLFRYVSHVACAQGEFLLSLAVVVGIGVYREVPALWPAVPLLIAAQAMAVIAFSAFGFFCGLITGRYVIIGLAYGAIVEVGIGNVPTQLNQLSMARHLMAIMRPILGDAEIGVSSAAGASALTAPAAVMALLGFAVVMLAATVAVFSFKELASGGGREA